MFLQEEPRNSSKKCKFLASCLKDTFAKYHSFRRKSSASSPEPEERASDNDEDEEVFVSSVISKYMESKCKRKSIVGIGYFKETGDLMVTPQSNQGYVEHRDEIMSATSRLSRCSSDTSFDAFVSVQTCFSRSSSLNKIDFQEFSKRSIIVECFPCDGWPFGLCRKTSLLPPLPKSPSDSWSWKKNGLNVSNGMHQQKISIKG